VQDSINKTNFLPQKNESSLGNRNNRQLRRIKNQTLEPNFYSANPIRKQPRFKSRKKEKKKVRVLLINLYHQRGTLIFYITLPTTLDK